MLPATIRADSVNLQVIEGTLTTCYGRLVGGDVEHQCAGRRCDAGAGSDDVRQLEQIVQTAYISFYDRVNNYQFTGTAVRRDDRAEYRRRRRNDQSATSRSDSRCE